MFSLVRKTRNSKREPESHCSLHRWHRSQRLLPVARASSATDCRGGHSSALEQIIQYISPSSVVLDYTYHVTILTKRLHTHTQSSDFFQSFSLIKILHIFPSFFSVCSLSFHFLFICYSWEILLESYSPRNNWSNREIWSLGTPIPSKNLVIGIKKWWSLKT